MLTFYFTTHILVSFVLSLVLYYTHWPGSNKKNTEKKLKLSSIKACLEVIDLKIRLSLSLYIVW